MTLLLARKFIYGDQWGEFGGYDNLNLQCKDYTGGIPAVNQHPIWGGGGG